MSDRTPEADPEYADAEHAPGAEDPETADSTPAPAGWRELEAVPAISERYQGRSPTAFEREERPLLVEVSPSEPNVAHGEKHWRVSLVEGSPTDRREVRPVRENLSDEASALDVAEDVMEQYNSRFATDDFGVEELADRL